MCPPRAILFLNAKQERSLQAASVSAIQLNLAEESLYVESKFARLHFVL